MNTELINRLELLISSVGIVIGLFVGVFLVYKRKKYSRLNVFLAIYFLVYSFRMAKSLFYNYYTINITVHYIFIGSLLLIGPSLWLYDTGLRKRVIGSVKQLIHYIPFGIFVSISWLIPYQSSKPILFLGIFIHGLVYCLVLFYKQLSNQSLSERESQIKLWLLLLTILTIGMFSNSILIFFEIVSFYPTSAFLFSLSVIVLSLYAFNNLWLFMPEKEKYSNSSLNKENASEQYQKLKEAIEKDKLYLNTELSLTRLSKLIGISSKQLSQIINQIEKKNYSQFIATYRIEEAKRLLKDPNYSNYKISAIAYESGFNSISSFNSTFKKVTNTTAIKFREL